MKIKIRFLIPLPLVVSIIVLLFSGCEKDNFNEGALDEYLKNMPLIASQMPAEKAPAIKSTVDETTSEYIYHYDYYEAAAGLDERRFAADDKDAVVGEVTLNCQQQTICVKRGTCINGEIAVHIKGNIPHFCNRCAGSDDVEVMHGNQ
mgnify:CR=1 FL=1